MPALRRVRNSLVTHLQSAPRRARVRAQGLPVTRTEIQLTSSAGYLLFGALWAPSDIGRWPAVLLTPGTSDPGRVFDGWTQPLNARELASTGRAVLTFDPAGRGRSWGAEDYGGPEHQDNVRAFLLALADRPEVDPDRIGVVSISLGIAMACGALARWGDELPVKFLIDWEGPCDREIITAGGKIMAPAMGHSLRDEVYWRPREAVRHVGALKCGYHRIQADRDHAQPGERRHAERMIAAAAEGDLPWFRLNEHPPGVAPAAPEWIKGGRANANRSLLRWIREHGGG